MKTAHQSVGAFEAKNRFSELLERVGHGSEFTITKHDRPIARLVPAGKPEAEQRMAAAEEIRQLSQRYSLEGISARKLVDEGRR